MARDGKDGCLSVFDAGNWYGKASVSLRIGIGIGINGHIDR